MNASTSDTSGAPRKRRAWLVVMSVLAGLGVFAGSAFAVLHETVQGNGRAAREVRAAAGFSKLALSLPGEVELRVGETEGVVLEGDENILPLIEVVVQGGSLELRPVRKNLTLKPKQLKLTVNAKQIEAIAVAGSGNVRSSSDLRAPKLRLSIAGSGDAVLDNLNTESISASVAGSGDVKLTGRARKLDVSIAGSGDVAAGKLATDAVSISVAGSGNAVVWARDALSVSVAGSGDVQYWGDPRLSKSVLGSGKLRRLGAAPT